MTTRLHSRAYYNILLHSCEGERGGNNKNISEEEDITDELYLELVVHDEEEDDRESDKEDEEDCNAGEFDEGSP
eukprot:9706611-Ditylum_brightwellii.AAC.1